MTLFASFDIGTRNLGCVIVDVDQQLLLQNGEQIEQQALSEKITSIAQAVRIQEVFLIDLAQTKNQKLNKVVYLRLFDWLDSQETWWSKCSNVVIESQLARNFKASSLMHALQSWFLIKYRDNKNVILFPSRMKTIIMGASTRVKNNDGKWKSTTKTYRKNFCKNLTRQSLTQIGDTKGHSLIFEKAKQKQDDLCDCYVQTLAYIKTTTS